jgi:hypothetical protein
MVLWKKKRILFSIFTSADKQSPKSIIANTQPKKIKPCWGKKLGSVLTEDDSVVTTLA